MPDINLDLAATAHIGPRLGPATVCTVLGSQLEVAMDGQRLIATLAVPALYRPVAGDTVLVIRSDGDPAYVIGVLHATGPMVVQAPGDLCLSAPCGTVRIEAAAIEAAAPEIRVDAGRMSIGAGELVETLGSARRTVRDLFEVDAQSIRFRARALFSIVAGRLRARAAEDVKIDGARIHLG